MEEKIYDRQVTKQSLSFRVVDQQQIERHFTMNELTELYTFEPDQLDDPSEKKSKRSTPVLPKVRGTFTAIPMHPANYIVHLGCCRTSTCNYLNVYLFLIIKSHKFNAPKAVLWVHAAFELYRG